MPLLQAAVFPRDFDLVRSVLNKLGEVVLRGSRWARSFRIFGYVNRQEDKEGREAIPVFALAASRGLFNQF
jgi:hypothetical protein